MKSKSENSAKDAYALTSPISKKQRRTNAQTIVAAIQEQLKFIKQESMKPSINEDMSRCVDYEQVHTFLKEALRAFSRSRSFLLFILWNYFTLKVSVHCIIFQTGYGMTNEEWLLSLSSVNTPTLITVM